MDLNETIDSLEKEVEVESASETEELEKELELQEGLEEISLDDIAKILSLTIKKDDTNKKLTFLTQLSAFTPESQLNLASSSPSSTGKSYIALEIAKLFPESAVVQLGYASPTSFFHEYGEYDKEKHLKTIDLERKIIIFLDMPHTKLLERLRPILSHDKKEIESKITNSRKQRTERILLKGYSSFIFCSANPRIDEQEATRFILTSPDTDKEKIKNAVRLKVKKEIANGKYQEEIDSNPERQNLIKRIRAIQRANIKEITINAGTSSIVESFIAKRTLKPRHTRDIDKVLSLTKTLALLNLWTRADELGEAGEPRKIRATKEDFREALTLWNKVSEAQELNISPYCLEVFKRVFEPLAIDGKGVAREEIARNYSDIYGRNISDWGLKKSIIPAWENAGLTFIDNDPLDARKKLIFKS